MTDYCKYHPLIAATFACHGCHSGRCDQCIEVTKRYKPARCLSCHEEVEDLGGSNEAVPFWRRLEQGFRYPLKTETMILLVIISFLTVFVSYLPFAFLWVLMLVGTLFKYALICLEHTAKGQMEAPAISNAYGGGLTLIGKFLVMIVILFGVTIAAYIYIGPMISSFFGAIILFSLPSVMINFAMTESVLESVSPEANYRLIKSVGLPYGLLLGLLMVMLASVGVAGSIFPDGSVVSAGLQSLVGNYYLIVAFHLMGYMLYQYQHELGYSARPNGETFLEMRSERERLSSLIDINLKEGDFQTLLQLFSQGLKQFPADTILHKQCFDFMLATKNVEHLPSVASKYLLHLQASAKLDLIGVSYKRVLQVLPEFIPNSPESRIALAKQFHQGNDYKMVVRVIHGMHKEFPESDQLIPAYNLMAQALEQLPNMQVRAAQVRSVIVRLEQLKRQRIKQGQLDREAERLKLSQQVLPALDIKSTAGKKKSQQQEMQPKSGPVSFMTGPAFDIPAPVPSKQNIKSVGGAQATTSINSAGPVENIAIAANKPRGVKKKTSVDPSNPSYMSRTDRMASVLEQRFVQQAEEAKGVGALEGAENVASTAHSDDTQNQKKPKDSAESDAPPIDFE